MNEIVFYDANKKARAILALRDQERARIEEEESKGVVFSEADRLARLTVPLTPEAILEEYKKLGGKWEMVFVPEPPKPEILKKARRMKKAKKAKKLGKKLGKKRK
jgi:hypothetical protein